MTLGTALLRRVANYLKIGSMKDVVKMLMPYVTKFILNPAKRMKVA
jgi:hypothetical protein